jgi:hypothetical protein
MCIDNKRQNLYKGLSIHHEERMELNGKMEMGKWKWENGNGKMEINDTIMDFHFITTQSQ